MNGNVNHYNRKKEGRKEMFYLMTHNSFYLRLYGVRHVVKDHSESKRRNPLLLLHELPFAD